MVDIKGFTNIEIPTVNQLAITLITIPNKPSETLKKMTMSHSIE